MPGRIGAVIVEVSGSGEDTILDLHSFQSVELPEGLVSALGAIDTEKVIDAREQADLNFLILHNLNSLFFDLLDSAEVSPNEIDLIGLKGMEIGGKEFPDDPGALSELTGCVVATCFRIGPDKGIDSWLPVKEAILKGMVESMVEKYDIDEEVREAVAVALLANESVYHETVSGALEATSRSITVQRGSGNEPALHGEFYFPAE